MEKKEHLDVAMVEKAFPCFGLRSCSWKRWRTKRWGGGATEGKPAVAAATGFFFFSDMTATMLWDEADGMKPEILRQSIDDDDDT